MKRSVFYLGSLCLLVVAGCNSRTGKGMLYEDVPPGTTGYSVSVWQCVEISFVAGKSYDDPLTGDGQCEMDVVFTHGDGAVIERPAFWDGKNRFKVRFAPTKPGVWSYQTFCVQDEKLHGLGGTVGACRYTGDLAVYKHGFPGIGENGRYFVYNDGTPFFYLGDTHWSFPFEAFDSSNVAGVPSQFKELVDTRIRQGFTVYQSEPAGPLYYTLANRLEEDDLAGFADLDRKFAYLAEQGMVHANAQLVWAGELTSNRASYPDEYLDRLARYWVARYGAWPVMWTCAQECDNDFYHDKGDHAFDAESNPWKTVLKALHKYDAYRHPLSAHMEYASGEALKDGHGTIASNSSFKDMDGHDWYACQWAPGKRTQLDFRVPEDFWNSDVTKPTVNYEGHYDHFWTNTFGARMQGWTAYLNGMAGHGYGAAGIWLIINEYPGNLAGAYDLDKDSNNEGILVGSEEKRMTWDKALLLPAAEQLGKHMRSFFESMEWWKLTPRFGDPAWSALPEAFYALATIDRDSYVCYLYHPDTSTGSLKNMRTDRTYAAQWFDPSTGEYRNIGEVKADCEGNWRIPPKPSAEDWVLLVK
jgi:hypothetical protein